MKRAGFTFALASNGLEAVQAIEKMEAGGSNPGMYDVVLVSCMRIFQGAGSTFSPLDGSRNASHVGSLSLVFIIFTSIHI